MTINGPTEMRDDLSLVYGPDIEGLMTRILALVEEYKGNHTPSGHGVAFSEQDTVLITYGDSLAEPGRAPLATLKDFYLSHLKEMVGAVHILPFHPFSSDDGFSVIDFKGINPVLGDWTHVESLANSTKLMADAVVNHISAQSSWFQSYLEGDKAFEAFFIDQDPDVDLSAVVRPRTSPLLTSFRRANGETAHIWTTFSADQIDLNYRSPDLLLAVLDVLLNLVARGAQMLRLDAVTFLWKELGTASVHLPQTHALVRIMRQTVHALDPSVVLITETNVPHKENISYFGDGRPEAHMVYNFALPPLLAYSLITGDARALSDWTESLEVPSAETCFFNFTASHDGVGVRALEGILSDQERDKLVTAAQEAGGYVSYRSTADGSDVPYELNCNYLDLISGADDDSARMADRFAASQAVAMMLPGVPAFYIHSLLGSRGDRALAQRTGRARSINRAQMAVDDVIEALEDKDSLRAHVYRRLKHLLAVRRGLPAFHPSAPCRVLRKGDGIFALERTSSQGERLFCAVNMTGKLISIKVEDKYAGSNLLTERHVRAGMCDLAPYEILWVLSQDDID